MPIQIPNPIQKKSDYLTTIAIDTSHSTIHYYSMLGTDQSSIVHNVKSYSGFTFDDAFFTRFKEIIGEFVAETPSESVRRISLVLPDNAVAVDTVNVPTMRSKSATKNALDLALGEIYRNRSDLRISYHQAAQNRQYTTFNTSAIQKKILTGIYSVCSENKMLVDTTTFASGSTVGAISSINPKMKNATYLFLDIKDTYSRFIFVVNGRAVGFYPIPFGLEFLDGQKYIQEDMLFDHTMAELTVLNAREKAKAKKLTVLAEQQETQKEDETQNTAAPAENTERTEAAEAQVHEDSDFIEEPEQEHVDSMAEPFTMNVGQRIIPQKVMGKKTPRRLPKFMQRPIPETAEEIVNENFRVFVKWALSLLISNEKIVGLGMPDFVCVNIPEHLSFTLDYVNDQRAENGLEFRRLTANHATANVLSNLELYGAFFPKSIHKSTKF